MEVFIQGKGKETLDKRHYVSSGGEGSIYTKNGIAYKIYLEPSHMIPEDKVRELSALTLSNIIKPENIVLNGKNQKIGYTMKYIKDTVSLCQIFTKAYKDRNNIKPDSILKLVNQLRDGVKHCHDNNILIVDLNELNFLVNSSKYDTVYFIDVDSYQTPTYQATAIMDSIRDRHAKKWSRETDWFSFGIIAFQMFVGVHPFKGKHKVHKDLDSRMQNNISVFNADVSMPPVALPLTNIPENYRNWFKSIFESAQRMSPPFGDVTVVIPVVIKTVTGTNNYDINLVADYMEEIVSYISPDVILTTKGLSYNGKIDSKVAPYAYVAVTPKLNHVVTSIIKNGQVLLYDATTGKDMECSIKADKLMTYGKRLYAKYEDSVFEIEFIEYNHTKISATMTTVCNILPSATQVFDGVLIQDLLGAKYASVFPESKTHQQIRLKELDEYRVLDAKYEDQVLILIGEKGGEYYEFTFVFDFYNYSLYRCTFHKVAGFYGINFTVLDKGVVAKITQEGYLELFVNVKDEGHVKLVQDTALADGKLFHEGDRVLMAKGTKIYSVALSIKK